MWLSRWIITGAGVMLFLAVSTSHAQLGRTILIKVDGHQFQPDKLTAWSGDTLKICNEGSYRRQPYSQSRHNKFGKRRQDSGLMLKTGECVEVKIQNPTQKWIKMRVRDAVQAKAKLEIDVNPSLKIKPR